MYKWGYSICTKHTYLIVCVILCSTKKHTKPFIVLPWNEMDSRPIVCTSYTSPRYIPTKSLKCLENHIDMCIYI